ncbi:MAG: SRPBCC domain-containing protein [Methanomassiliicoccales archaeon]|nr:SRPBCC domain-containing protein [Methanomassiliicoccales archaeon]
MKQIGATIEIDAPIERVWGTIADFASYKDWNPCIRSISGEAKPHSALWITGSSTRGKITNFPGEVLKVESNKELSIKGIFAKGLVTSEHRFLFESLGPTRTRFSQVDTFEGSLASLFGGTLRDMEKGFEQMNEALKRRCEE